MKKPHHRKPADALSAAVRTVDECGQPIVLVPLAGGRTAKLLAESYDDLLRRGVSPAWALNSNGKTARYVRCHDPNSRGELQTVARLIVGAGPGEIVRYRSGDRLDLRPDNLMVSSGPAKRDCHHATGDAVGLARDQGRRGSLRPPERAGQPPAVQQGPRLTRPWISAGVS